MSSRYIQVVAIRQKIERLQAQLDYLEKLDHLENHQNSVLLESDEKKLQR